MVVSRYKPPSKDGVTPQSSGDTHATTEISSEAVKAKWEQEKLAKVGIKVFRGHRSAVTTCMFMDEGKRFLSGGVDKTVRIWDAGEGTHQLCLTGHRDKITCARASQDSRKVASTSLDKKLIIWDIVAEKRMLEFQHEGMAMSCDVSHDSKYILSCSDLDNAVMVWDLRQQKSIKKLTHHTNTPLCVRFARNSYRFCSTAMDMTSRITDMLDYRDNIKPHQSLQFRGHTNMISSCDFSHDERWMCSVGWDKKFNLWDVKAGVYRNGGPIDFSRDGHEGTISAVKFFPKTNQMITSSYDQTIILWDIANEVKKFGLQAHTDWVTDCDVSPCEKFVLSASKDGTLRYWNIEKADEIPAVLQNRKNIGLRMIQCKRCKKQFSISQAADESSVHLCVFCRLEDERDGA